MTIHTSRGRSLVTWLAFACVLALIVTAGLYLVFRSSNGTKLSAYFGKTVGLYAGSSVRVLGVPVGEVTDVTPQGDAVRVDMRVDDVPLPAGVGAVVVAPSLVSDRYVQLTPAYDSGPVLASGTVLAKDRTATPVELDDLYSSLDKLSTALGPNGANKDGALSGVLDTAANTLKGNGASLNSTVGQLADLAKTLDGSKDDLFSTVQNLNSFTGALAQSDRQLNEFYGRVADVSRFLAADSSEVGAALQSLGGALGDVQQFVNDNKTALESNVDKLASLSKVLVDQRAALAEVLDIAPTGATNFINSYDAASGTIAVRDNLNELTNPPILTVCRLISAVTPKEVPDALGNICKQLAPILDGALKLPTIPQVLNSLQNGTLPPLPLPLVDVMEQLSGGAK
ncbi:ABC transporter substrate-binding protein [Amycolatopsis mediterranei S699]|uniref:ABC transport system substrate-binding protein n=2 Tax=Amycolatopsis mediterranei TaxID=33910 RepID=A0A0H3D1S2_AMYMU|nr:MCE family protein [Amycolatopsis mediterranei]ADJ44227.1 ABC transport system substrate-binding protein [Amycolatopsis mediterranei U32]AEK40963.1 ABC transporter substrate-binding protein [Amycolatopsis mediterranei S699]AFO75940.1 ABC transporter substrate-binding protein [Amycolatopsis mediterranei S699]AGT83069.1 ABC transporter substrate-binding protein [Amycolatopsis mediterranei RB]KDO06856.1 ABC transporter substrate-binding protein [Amycolatopsis mediterranei]